MMTERQELFNLIVGAKDQLPKAERSVLECIEQASLADRCITQKNIAKQTSFLGAHRQYESTTSETTTERRVRQLVNNLITQYHIPIVACEKGHRFPVAKSEVEEMKDIKIKAAIKHLKSHIETARALAESCNIEFDQDEVNNQVLRMLSSFYDPNEGGL